MFVSRQSAPEIMMLCTPVQLTNALPVGAHLASPRRGYSHHGIHAGDGMVIHYAGFARSWRAEPIEEVPLPEFARGRPLRIIDHAEAAFAAQEIVARARARLGEHHYALLRNNCEHFCNWCINGLHHSRQADRLGRWLSTLSPSINTFVDNHQYS